MGGAHTERSTLAACVAHVLGAAAVDIPLDDAELRAYLGERGVGLVPVADATSFAWAGAWIARRPAAAGGEPRAVVMFGVPSGVIFDPAGTTEQILDGLVLAPLDLVTWPPTPAGAIAAGTVEAIVIAPTATAPAISVDAAQAVPERGLVGRPLLRGRRDVRVRAPRLGAHARRRRRAGRADR